MSEIALYNAFTKLGLSHDEAKEAVADVASTKDVATKADLKEGLAELKADNKAIKWLLGLLVAINVAFIVSAVSLLVRFL